MILIASIGLMTVESFSMLPLPLAATSKSSTSTAATRRGRQIFFSKLTNDDGVVELATDEEAEEETKSQSQPTGGVTFLSQGEIDEETLVLTDDPKQTRVIIYIILSLIPVLFLIPLMLGTRDLIPLDSLPPVQM
jgi:hypothetical protein